MLALTSVGATLTCLVVDACFYRHSKFVRGDAKIGYVIVPCISTRVILDDVRWLGDTSNVLDLLLPVGRLRSPS